jgi:methyl-accepting chemotaxis protein-2 (aspartate sensor receptor)
MNLSKKFMFSIGVMLISVFLLLTLFVVRNSMNVLNNMNQHQMTNTLESAYLLTNLMVDMLNREIDNDLGAVVLHYADGIKIDNDEIVDINGVQVPSITFHGIPIYEDYSSIDAFKNDVGADMTIFVRNSDGDFVRASTTLINTEGNRAVGTKLAEGQALANIRKGQEYQGRALLFGKDYITKYSPIFDSNKNIIGIFFVGLFIGDQIDRLQKLLSELKLGKTGYIAIISAAKNNYGTFLVHPTLKGRNALEVKNNKGGDIFQRIMSVGEGSTEYTRIDDNGKLLEMVTYYINYEPWEWQILGLLPKSELTAPAYSLAYKLSLFTSIFFIISMVLIAVISRKILTKPLNQLIDALNVLNSGEGDLTKNLEIKSRDELGILASKFNIFIGNIHKIITEVIKSSSSVVSGNNQLASTLEEFSSIFKTQTQKMSSLQENIQDISNASDNTSNSVEANIGIINCATDKTEEGHNNLAGVINNINTIKSKTETLAEAVDSLSNSVRDIGAILSVINDIADQTNLLALNAAIEAARAGDAGRGFAVVADEVRMLAERTQKATAEIQVIIGQLQKVSKNASGEMKNVLQSVKEGIGSAEVTNKSFDEIIEMVSLIGKNSASISSEMSEQGRIVQKSNTDMSHITISVEQSSTSVDNVMHTVKEIQEITLQLKTIVSVFKV